MCWGTRAMRVKSPIRGRLRMSSITLPMYMLTMTPQNMSGRWETSMGPGRIPCSIKAPSRLAAGDTWT